MTSGSETVSNRITTDLMNSELPPTVPTQTKNNP